MFVILSHYILPCLVYCTIVFSVLKTQRYWHSGLSLRGMYSYDIDWYCPRGFNMLVKKIHIYFFPWLFFIFSAAQHVISKADIYVSNWCYIEFQCKVAVQWRLFRSLESFKICQVFPHLRWYNLYCNLRFILNKRPNEILPKADHYEYILHCCSRYLVLVEEAAALWSHPPGKQLGSAYTQQEFVELFINCCLQCYVGGVCFRTVRQWNTDFRFYILF